MNTCIYICIHIYLDTQWWRWPGPWQWQRRWRRQFRVWHPHWNPRTFVYGNAQRWPRRLLPRRGPRLRLWSHPSSHQPVLPPPHPLLLRLVHDYYLRFIYMYLYVYINVCVYIFVDIYIYRFIHVYIFLYMCIHVCIYKYMNVYINICVCVYLDTRRWRWPWSWRWRQCHFRVWRFRRNPRTFVYYTPDNDLDVSFGDVGLVCDSDRTLFSPTCPPPHAPSSPWTLHSPCRRQLFTIYVYISVCIHKCVCIYIFRYIHIYIHTCICISIYVYTCMYI